MGHTPSIMDYARFNYVAQPEDHIPVDDLIPNVGPYDKWAVHWGYAEILEARTPDDELKTLNAWSREQDQTPWLRFSTANSNGPGENVEAVGDQDAIRSTAAGLRNLNRVMEYLPGVTNRQGEGYWDLGSIYERVLGQWALEMRHVAAIVGGMESQQKHYGQEGVRFAAVPKERQRAAVQFLAENAFATPKMLIRPDVLRRMEPTGELGRIRNAQMGILTLLLGPARIQRLVEQEAIDGVAAYRPERFLGDVRMAIFQELRAASPNVDAYRRNLQRGYVELLAGRMNQRGVTDDTRPLFRGELKLLNEDISRSLPKMARGETRLHFEDLRDQIAMALDPRFQVPATQGAAVSFSAFDAEGADANAPIAVGTCWPDYSIKAERR
jgi:hypothetical protein